MPIVCVVVRFAFHHKLELGSAADLSKPYGIADEICLAYILRDTLTALDYLHQRALIHRAVRGSHILVGRDGRCVLSGLKYCTSIIQDGKWQTAIHSYPSNATPNLNWLSPEVLEQNLLGYDQKSDIYSLGVTCCELANGVGECCWHSSINYVTLQRPFVLSSSPVQCRSTICIQRKCCSTN